MMSKYVWIVCGLLIPGLSLAQSTSKAPSANDFLVRGKTLFLIEDYSSASDYLTESIELDARNQEAYFWRSQAFFQLQKYYKALSDVNHALEIESGDLEAIHLKLNILNKLNRPLGEIETRLTLHELAPSTENSLILAKLFNQTENFEDARQWYKQVLTKDPNNKEALVDLENLPNEDKGKLLQYSIENGLAFLEHQQWEKAQIICQEYIKSHPEDPQGYYCLSIATQNQNQYTSALSFARKAIQIDPFSQKHLFQLGELHYYFGNYQPAADAYEQVLTYDADHQTAKERLERCNLHLQPESQAQAITLVEKGVNTQMQTYEQLTLKEGKDYLSANSRGKGYQLLGQHQAAIEAFSNAIAQKPDFAESYFNRGHCYYELKEFKQSILDFTQALSLDADLAVAHLMRGQAYLQLNQLNKALDDLNLSLAINPNLVKALSNRSAIFYTLGQYQAALEDLNRAIQLNPKDESLLANRGNIYLVKQQYQAAYSDFQKASTLRTDDAKIYYYSAASAMHMKRYDKALLEVEKTLNLLEPRLKKHSKNKLDQDFWIEAMYLKGYLLHETGQLAGAEAAYTDVLKRKPSYGEVWYNRGILRQQRDKIKEACADINQAVALGYEVDDLAIISEFCAGLLKE